MRLTRKRTEQDVLAFIIEHGSINMSQRTISKEIGHSSSTVARALESLEEQGLIKVDKSDVTSKPNTISYSGPRKIKKSTAEVINSVMSMSRDILDTVTESKRIKPIDNNIPEAIDPSKVILYKQLPDVKAYMIVVKL